MQTRRDITSGCGRPDIATAMGFSTHLCLVFILFFFYFFSFLSAAFSWWCLFRFLPLLKRQQSRVAKNILEYFRCLFDVMAVM